MSVAMVLGLVRGRRARWLVGAAVVILAMVAFVYWRPMTVLDALGRARLRAAGVRDGYAAVGSYRIHYLTAGKGRPILLLHGLGGNAQQFGSYITTLARDGRVVAPDLLGFGRSSQPDVAYSTPLEAETVRAFLDALKIPQADIVGLSLGGAAAAELARQTPGRVRRLVLVSAGGLMVNPAWAMPFAPRTAADVPRLEWMLGPRQPMIPAFARRDVVRAMQPYGWVVERFVARRKAGLDLLDGKLGTLDMPVLLVWGSRDVISPLEQAEAFHRQIPQSELLVLQGCGHIALLDCSSVAQPEIRSFLAAARPPQGGRRELAVD